ncbi:MAG: hypothetical protein LBS89_08860, partial [Zoogloeaceae bacterium]|nr:hypothetical protein [Zoogloeaceae bacterium]
MKQDKTPKRHRDLHYSYHDYHFRYRTETPDIDVRCPHCQKRGVIQGGDFQCLHCGRREEYVRQMLRKVDEICIHCERRFRIEITDPVQKRLKTLRVACPHCQTAQTAPVQPSAIDPEEDYRSVYRYPPHKRKHPDSREQQSSGRDPYFGLELYYQTELGGKVLWAYNRAHLLYLIDYLDADLREAPHGFGCTKSQSDHLPRFFKLARHRQTLVKRLRD